MTIVNIHQAKTHLSALIKKAMDGEEVIIANKNEPVIHLKPIIKKINKRKPGMLRGKIKFIGDWKQSDQEVEDLLLNNL